METNNIVTEVSENNETVSGGDILPQTMSGGDALQIMTILENESALTSDLLTEIQTTNKYLEDIHAEVIKEPETIWTKPIEEYTVGESFGLVITIILVGIVIFKVVGGIIQCKL